MSQHKQTTEGKKKLDKPVSYPPTLHSFTQPYHM